MSQGSSHILNLLVDNEFGVLTRVSSQIRREGWNIKSLAVAETMDPAISRITLSVECFAVTLPSVLMKLKRLHCVRSVIAYEPEKFVCRELAVIRFTPHDTNAMSVGIIGDCTMREISRSVDTIMLEVTGSPDSLTECIEAFKKLGTVEAARTGAITLEK